MMESIKPKEYSGVDLMKFIMAIFVVAIHTRPFIGIENNIFVNLWDEAVKLAVPYFFMASGYFLFIKINTEPDRTIQLTRIKTYGKRILQLYVLWTIIYLPITFIETTQNNIVFYKDLALFLRGIFFVGESYYSWPLWYLLSMIYSLLLIYFLLKINFKLKGIFIIAIIVYLISIVMNYIIDGQITGQYALTSKNLIQYSFGNGRIFSGMLYIMIGAMLSSPKIKISYIAVAIALAIGIIFQIYRYQFISEFSFILIRTVVFILSLRLSVSVALQPHFLRKCSTVLYFLHMIIFYCYIVFCHKTKYFGLIPFLICTIIPIMLTPLILHYEKRGKILQRLF